MLNMKRIFLLVFLLTIVVRATDAKSVGTLLHEYYNSENSISESANAQSLSIPVTTTGNLDGYTIDVPTNVDKKSVFDSIYTHNTLNTAAKVNALFTADFTFSDTQCSGTGVKFTPSVTGTYVYNWSFGDGEISSEEQPTHVYKTYGTLSQKYVVKLTITDNSTSYQNSIIKQIEVTQIPDGKLNGTGSGDFNGTPSFKECSNSTSAFTFTNGSTTSSTNQNYKIEWGDGTSNYESASFSTPVVHTYQSGLWNLTYTVEGLNGCKNTQKYIVFVGSNPKVSFGTPGNTDICSGKKLTFPVSGTENNPPGTTYTISFNDGSASGTYNQAPSEITHIFTSSSCGITSYDGTTTFPNSFSAKITANNPCGTSVVSVVPIYVSTPPIADFTLSPDTASINNKTIIANTSSGSSVNNVSCSVNTKIIWTISPSNGISLAKGIYGNDFGSTDQSVWVSGTDTISPVFSQPGTYTITMKISNRCDIDQKVKTYTVVEADRFTASLIEQKNVLCFGDSTGAITTLIHGGSQIEVSPGVFDYKYAWSGPNGYTSTKKDLTKIVAGTYNLKATDNDGRVTDFSVKITQPDEIQIGLETSPITCYRANNATIKLTLSGGVAPYKVNWAFASVGDKFQNNYATGLFQSNLAAGNYQITVTDANSCSKSIVVNISEAPIFRTKPVVKNVSCFGAKDGSITLNFEGGRTPISLVWSDNSTAGTTRNNLGAGSYRVIISDNTPCVIDTTFIISEPQQLTLTANITPVLDCNNSNSGAINLKVSGGTQPYNYLWSNKAITEDLDKIAAGNYLVTVTDANGCVQTAQFVVAKPSPIDISINTVTDLNCLTRKISKTFTANVTGGVPPYTLTWSSGTVTGANNEIMQITQSGLVLLNVVDALGCTSKYTFISDIPVLGIKYELLDCNTRKYQFKAIVPDENEVYIYSWDFGDGVSSTIRNPEHTFAIPGDFRVTLKYESANCVSQFADVVSVESLPVLQLDKLPTFCTGDSILLHVSGADAYRWSNGSEGNSLLVRQVGDYSVTGASKAGCTSTLNFKATNFESYNYTIQSDKDEITTENPSIQLWSESITYSKYFWDFGDGKSDEGNNLTHYYDNLKDGYYEVKLKVENPNGCNEYTTKKIWTNNISKSNVFTPNGDGINDVFMKGWHIKVYNRNGFLLYDGATGWDGTHNGRPVSNDTYFYVLYVTASNGVKTDTGFITVVR